MINLRTKLEVFTLYVDPLRRY